MLTGRRQADAAMLAGWPERNRVIGLSRCDQKRLAGNSPEYRKVKGQPDRPSLRVRQKLGSHILDFVTAFPEKFSKRHIAGITSPRWIAF